MSARNFLFSGVHFGPAASLGLLVLRLVFGLTMLRVGLFKVRGYDGLRAQWDDPTKILGDDVSLWLLLFAEVACSALVVLGLMTRLAVIPLVIAMTVATFVAHGDDPWVSATGEADKVKSLLFLGAFAALLLTGPGRYSADGALDRP